MKTRRTIKRKQQSGLKAAATAGGWIIALPAPNQTSDGNSNSLGPKMSVKKCDKEVTKVSGSLPKTPVKLPTNDEEIDVIDDTPSKSQVRSSPKAIASSPTTKTILSPSSRVRRGDSDAPLSCVRRFDFGSGCIQTNTMSFYTKGGFCFTRKVRKYIDLTSTKL